MSTGSYGRIGIGTTISGAPAVATWSLLHDDVEAAIWERIGGGFHQVGTTRMSARAEDGVVDPNLAVHGVPNLFVASSSTFVTSSQANSTFMIMVFAVRLADHLPTVL